MIRRRLLIVFSLILFMSHGLASSVAAHPLGNFTINHYVGLHLRPNLMEIDYVLDMAEIPAFQEIMSFDANSHGQVDPAKAAGYPTPKCAALQSELKLTIADQSAPLTLANAAVEFPPGAGNLPTLRLTCAFTTALAGQAGLNIQFENNVYRERIGWREIVVTADGLTLSGDLAAMTTSLSQRLTTYPNDLLNSPPAQRSVAFSLNRVGPSMGEIEPASAPNAPSKYTTPLREDGFTRLITLDELTLPAILLALAVAFAWGASHALTPGHGKTIVAAYLVGSRGTIRHAIFLGLTTTLTHTAGVFIVGLVTLFASRFILPEKLFPWLGVLSGGLVVGIGLSLFRGRWAGLSGKAANPLLNHDHREIGSARLYHSHGAGPAHRHLPPDSGSLTWRNLFALGVSGGLIPCPSALVVMLSAIALQRIGFGLVLIVAFSLGLAGVLTGIGIVWVQARRLLERAPGQIDSRFGRLAAVRPILQWLPAVSALFITLIGLGITVQAFVQTGLLAG